MHPVLSVPEGLGVINVGEMISLPGLVSGKTKTANRLSGAAQEIFRNVASLLDSLVLYAIEKRTAAEFIATFNDDFPKYFNGALGLTYLAGAIVPKQVLEVLSGEFFSEMEADFREQGLIAFGAAVRDQAIFTSWTLRKISDICRRIDECPIAPGLHKQDLDVFKEFAFHSMRTRFHLHCLYSSMHHQKPIYPDVLGVVVDGLRSAVDAHAWARRALDLRVPLAEPEVAPVNWDDEEQQLLNEATFDMLTEPV